jgi:hypothetical protein
MENSNHPPIFLKGNKLECENYWRISLLDAAYKIFTDILASIEVDLLHDRSTDGHTFTTKQILQKSHE